MYCVLCTVSCVLCTVYYVLCTVYCVLCTVYCVLCTVYCGLCTVYCVLCAVYCVLCTVYCALCTVYCVLCTVHCALCAVCYLLYSALCPCLRQHFFLQLEMRSSQSLSSLYNVGTTHHHSHTRSSPSPVHPKLYSTWTLILVYLHLQASTRRHASCSSARCG